MKTFKESLVAIEEKLAEVEQAKANIDKEEMYKMMENMYSYIMQEIGYWREGMTEEVNYLHDMLGEHMQNHLPKIIGADKMNKALKTLGLDGDYVCNPKVLYSSTGKPSKLLMEFTKVEASSKE